MENPPTEELLKKIQELEAGQEHLKHEMSKLKLSSGESTKSENTHRRSHSVSPHRTRLTSASRKGSGGVGFDGTGWRKVGSASFRHSSPLQRESRSCDNGGGRAEQGEAPGGGAGTRGPAAVNFTDRQYLNILQSIGQSVHIFDLSGHIIYWCVLVFNIFYFW